MSKIETGGSAFPMQEPQAIHAYAVAAVDGVTDPDERDRAYLKARGEAVGGMTLRQYAAIHLRVPNSGTDWLDDMIAKARLLDASDRAMQGLVVGVNRPDPENIAFLARKQGRALHG